VQCALRICFPLHFCSFYAFWVWSQSCLVPVAFNNFSNFQLRVFQKAPKVAKIPPVAAAKPSAAKEKMSMSNLEAALQEILASLGAESNVGEQLRSLPVLKHLRHGGNQASNFDFEVSAH
jgi:hypothetical protein